jgi:carboxyl-terminal processing protease
MADLPVLSKVLFYARENYYDKSRLEPRRMLLGALGFVQRDVPEIVVEPVPIEAPNRVVVTVSGESRTFHIDRVDQPWSLRTKLQHILRFAQARLQPVSEAEEGQRLLDIEMSAANGMLYTLDPHSVLLDAATYARMRGGGHLPAGAVGLALGFDAQRRICVTKLVPGAPAERTGVRVRDRIIQIDDEPTTGLTLEDAAARLQGDVGSGIDLHFEREGARAPQKIHMERARVPYTSLDSGPRVLTTPDGSSAPTTKIGYFHLAHLAADAGGAVEDALRELARQGVGGIVLDLRGNSGGLYAQAVRVADAFTKKGTIVSMVGVRSDMRKDEVAKDDGNEPDVPVAVLVDHHTASGAEIVAAALRNLDRAIILGRHTIGMGTVQVLFDVPSPLAGADDGGPTSKLGLKLTTAQFLTTGDMPIQLRGVAPDFEVRSVTVARVGQRSVFQIEPLPPKTEAAYEWALAPPGAVVPPGHPRMTIDYLAPPASELPIGSDAGDDERVPGRWRTYSGDDFEATFAAELLAYMRQPGRSSARAVTAYVGLIKAREDAGITAAASALKTDWRAGPLTPALRLSFKIEPAGGGPVRAGAEAHFRGTVSNAGDKPAFRVRAVLASDNPLFDGLEMPFGSVPPGESRTFELAVPVPPTSYGRTDLVRAHLRDDGGDLLLATAAETMIDIESRPIPVLSFTCRAIEPAPRAGAGGHAAVRLVMQISNQGKVAAEQAEATVRRAGDLVRDGLRVRVSRWSGAIAAGAKKEASFVVELPADQKGGPVDLELRLSDLASPDLVAARMRISLRPSPTGGSWQVTPATVSATPPLLTINAPAVVSSETVHVTGEVSADTAARDVFIQVWNRSLKIPVRKVFYRNAKVEAARLPFEADVPIWAGSNIIMVHARNNHGTRASRAVVVLRRTDGQAVAR